MAKKTSVTIKGVKQAQDSALKFLNTRSQDKKILDQIGSDLVLQIQRRTKSKLEEYKQSELTNITVQARKIYSEIYDTSEFSSPKQSNLTLTGQLLNSISNKIIQSSSTIVLFLKDFRKNRVIPDSLVKEYYNKAIDKDNNATNSKRKDPRVKDQLTALFLLKNAKPKTNNQIKDELEAQGRKFLFMSAKLKLQLEDSITKELRRQLTLYDKIRRKLSL